MGFSSAQTKLGKVRIPGTSTGICREMLELLTESYLTEYRDDITEPENLINIKYLMKYIKISIIS